MGAKFTRRRFLTAVGAGAMCLTLTNTMGFEPRERTPKVRALHTPGAGLLHAPKVYPLPGVSSAPSKGVWAFHSRPDLGPPAVEVTTRAHDTAPGYIFVAPEQGGAAQGGSLIIDDHGQVVWFRPLQDNLLISARETSTVYKIDCHTGEVMWRLGGKKSDFEMGEGPRFAFQHDARRLPDGNISIFDNGPLDFENGIPKAVEESRAIA